MRANSSRPLRPRRRATRAPARTGGNGVRQGVHDVVADVLPAPVELAPGVAVAGANSSSDSAVRSSVGADDRGRAVGSGIGQHERCPAPPQSVLLEAECGGGRARPLPADRRPRRGRCGSPERSLRRCGPRPRPRSLPSTTVTDHPASASTLAAVSPLGPAPTTTASVMRSPAHPAFGHAGGRAVRQRRPLTHPVRLRTRGVVAGVAPVGLPVRAGRSQPGSPKLHQELS